MSDVVGRLLSPTIDQELESGFCQSFYSTSLYFRIHSWKYSYIFDLIMAPPPQLAHNLREGQVGIRRKRSGLSPIVSFYHLILTGER